MFMRLFRYIKDHPSRRRWRYVSTSRHGAGLLLLMLLVVMVYGYWYMTNDRRIRRYAENFLGDLTGGRVKIDHAHMGIFGKISLNKVRIFMPGGESPQPFFRAETINIRHRPWSLFIKGQLRPTEVICQNSVLTMQYDAATGRNLTYGYLRHTGTGGGIQPAKWKDLMATVRLRRVRLRTVVVDKDMKQLVDESTIDISMTPGEGNKYSIAYEGQHRAGESFLQGSMDLDMSSGEIVPSGRADIKGLIKTLPPKYQRWLQRFDPKGELHYKGRTNLDGQQVVFETELDGVSLTLPEELGGLLLDNVCGTLLFSEDGVKLEEITGQIEQAGRAGFEIRGQYRGLKPDSPYDVEITIRDMSIPAPAKLAGDGEKPRALAAILAEVHRRFQPKGPVNITTICKRTKEGKTTFSGTAEPRGVSMVYHKFRYPLQDVRGTVKFDSNQIVIKKVTGRGNGAMVTITGRVIPRDKQYDVTVSAENLPLDDKLRTAMYEGLHNLWDAVSPAGRASATARVYRGPDDKKRHTDVRVSMNGRAKIKYAGFPYPLTGLVGEVAFDDDSLKISRTRPLMASGGQMRCKIYGVINDLRSKAPVPKLTVEAVRVPIDQTLLSAVGEKARKIISQFHPAGTLRKVVAEVGRKPSGELDYSVLVEVHQGAFRYAKLPYPVDNVSGRISIRPDRAIIEGITGSHEKTVIGVSGQVFLRTKTPGVDLHIEAEDVKLEKELLDSLPESLQAVWKRFSPTGVADIGIDLSQNVPEPGLNYRAAIKPKDMSITWRGLPYTVEGVTGTIIATPRTTTLKNLAVKSGKMRASLNGTITTEGNRTVSDLKLSAQNVPFKPMMVKALPGEVAALAKNFHKGGTVSFELPHLRIVTRKGGDSNPSTRPVAATTPKPKMRIEEWSIRGDVSVKDVKMDLGFGERKITGGISGSMSSNSKGLSIETDLNLDSVTWGKQSVKNLRARLLKTAASNLLRIENISARAYGGRLAGLAEIKLKEKPQYGLSVSVEEIKLDKLYAAVVGQAKTRPETDPQIKGLLAGNIQLIGVIGKPDTRQAFGVFRISKGSIFRLPVLLGLIRVIYLSLPGDSAFTSGNLTYQLTGEKLVFREIYLTGPGISIVGSGRMNTKTNKLDLNFLTGPPGKLPPIAGLDKIIQGLAREIMEIHVTGTLQKPRTKAQSLRSLDEAIRRLVNPSEQEVPPLPINE